MRHAPRRRETPITTAVAVTQGLSWGPSKAQALIAAIDERTQGYVHNHVGLIYKALDQLIEKGPRALHRSPPSGAAIYQLTATGKRQRRPRGRRSPGSSRADPHQTVLPSTPWGEGVGDERGHRQSPVHDPRMDRGYRPDPTSDGRTQYLRK